MTSNWYPPRNRTIGIGNPYTAENGDVINCLVTGGSIATQPYRRNIGIGEAEHVEGTYNDFTFNTPSLPSHHIIFQMPSAKAIYPTGMMLSSWTENTSLADRAFGALPTRFLLSASNDGQIWTPIFNQSDTLTIEYLVDNKFSSINDGQEDPIKDYPLYQDNNDTNPEIVEDVYFKQFEKTQTAYSWFKLSFDSNSPNFRIDKQYNSTAPPTYLPSGMRVSNFAVYGDDFAPPPPHTDVMSIMDFSMAIDPYGIGVVSNLIDGGVDVLIAIINPDQHLLSGRFGLFQFIGVPSLGLGYLRVAKVGTDVSGLVHNTPFRLNIEYAPFDNQKALTFIDGGIIYKNDVFDDGFHYFELQPSFGIAGLSPIGDISNDMGLVFYKLNGFYNIMNLAGVDYEGGTVAHSSTNYAKTFGMITDVNNSLVEDPFPRDEIYPTAQVGIVSNTSLTWNLPIPYEIFPFKYSEVVVQNNQLVIKLDKTSTADLYKIYLQAGRLYVDYSLNPTSMNILSAVVVVDDDTGRTVVYELSGYLYSQKTGVPFHRYNCSLTAQEVIDLATIPTDPVLPSGMPTELSYNKVVISGENQPININEFELFENNLNAMTNSYVKSIQDTNGTYYNSLVKDGTITQRKVVWGTDTITEADLPAIVADSTINPNTITLTETGINYNKVAGNTGKFNFYSHADGGNLNSVQIGTVKGWSSVFTDMGATAAPFFTIYTMPKGDGSDMGGWYNSRYILTESQSVEKIISGKLYTIADHQLSLSNISPSASFTDIILMVAISSSSNDIEEWDINIRSVDMVSEYVGGDLTIEFGHTHNLAITQNAVLHSTFNQVGMSATFYNDATQVFQTGLTATEGNSYNRVFNLIDENAYTGIITADVVTDEILPFYTGWTKSSYNVGDLTVIRADFALTSSVLWGHTFSPADKLKYSVGAHLGNLRKFQHIRMTGVLVETITEKAIEAGYSTAEIMYIRGGLGFGLTIRQAIEYGLDKVKPYHPKLVAMMAGQGF